VLYKRFKIVDTLTPIDETTITLKTETVTTNLFDTGSCVVYRHTVYHCNSRTPLPWST